MLVRIGGEGCAPLDRTSEIGIELGQVIGKSLIVILHLSPSVFRLRAIAPIPLTALRQEQKQNTVWIMFGRVARRRGIRLSQYPWRGPCGRPSLRESARAFLSYSLAR